MLIDPTVSEIFYSNCVNMFLDFSAALMILAAILTSITVNENLAAIIIIQWLRQASPITGLISYRCCHINTSLIETGLLGTCLVTWDKQTS